MARVEFEEVSKVFGDGTRAVDRLDLEIADGEFMVLVGPSGCGKTTALRMVAGLEDITDGIVRIGDRVVNDLSPKSRDIAMVFQSYALYPHLTVEDNIAFALKIKKMPKAGDPATRRRGGADPRPRGAAQAQAARAVGRPAAAGCDGARDRPPAGGVPHGRAALEPRREAPRADARGHQAHPGRPRRDDDLRHPRPGRGDDDGRPRRGDAKGRAAAGRAAAGALRRPGQRLRRRLHREPGDEHARGRASSARTEASRRCSARRSSRSTTRRSRGARRSRRTTDGGSCSASGPRTSTTRRSRTATAGRGFTGRVELSEALGSEVLVHFTVAAPQAVTDDVRELAEDVGDDRAVGAARGRAAAGRGDARRAVQPADAGAGGRVGRGRRRPAGTALLRSRDGARDPRRVNAAPPVTARAGRRSPRPRRQPVSTLGRAAEKPAREPMFSAATIWLTSFSSLARSCNSCVGS